MFFEWLARAKDNITIDGEAELVQSIEADYATYRKQFSALTDLRETGGATLGPAYYQETVYPLFAKVREACIGLRNLNEETMYAASVRAGNVAQARYLVHGARGRVGTDCGPDVQLVSRRADCPADPTFHGGIAENFVG